MKTSDETDATRRRGDGEREEIDKETEIIGLEDNSCEDTETSGDLAENVVCLSLFSLRYSKLF